MLRTTDVLARLGGDEFGVVLTDADVDYASTIAERITAQLEQSFQLDVASLSSARASASPSPPNMRRAVPSCSAAPMWPCTGPRSLVVRSTCTNTRPMTA